jgi:outer membrane protein OmpA-like peptidoglycan-associated protein
MSVSNLTQPYLEILMIKLIVLTLSILCLFNIAVHANPLTDRNTAADHKEEAGLGMGAIIGGLIAGPPGAIIGAAGGAWFGNKQEKKDSKLALLEKKLLKKQTQLAYLENEFSELRSSHSKTLQKVSIEKRFPSLQDLSRAVSLTVYFRSNSAKVNAEIIPRINRLATFLKEFPEVQLQIEAHADRRGHSTYNKELSKQRAQVISHELISAGLDSSRIHAHSFGESRAISAIGDEEGYVFDRRVDIHLTLDTET